MERWGILDIGTNTLHGAIYQTAGGAFEKEGAKILPSPIYAGIQNGILCQKGILALGQALREMRTWFQAQKIQKIHAFATASLRMADNAAAVCREMEALTGISIAVLTENAEAECDFLAVRAAADEPDGAGFDLGGGSMQIVAFQGNRLTAAVSMDMGTRRYWDQFVAGKRPTEAELSAIDQAATERLRQAPGTVYPRLYAMGGTAKCARKLWAALAQKPVDILQADNLRTLLQMPDFLEQAAKERYQTLTTGLVIMLALCARFQTAALQVLPWGVREGYLLKLMAGRE